MPARVDGAPSWLVLVHQLPARPSNLRVDIWRRLNRIGAVLLRNSLYVLPDTPETREDFEWVRTEIASRGGLVSILSGKVVDGYTEAELVRQFRTARAADYEQFVSDAEKTARDWRQPTGGSSRAARQRDLAKLRERLHAIKALDYFAAAGSREAEAIVDRLEGVMRGSSEIPRRSPLKSRDFNGRVWLTRPRPGIDRMASAWLIRRFIDPTARFVFGSLPARRGQIAFDMADVEFGHVGKACTYETFLHRFGIDNEAAFRVGQVVHDLDLKETRYRLPETATIGRLVDGLRDAIPDDDELLSHGIRMIDALARSYERERAPRPPRHARRRSAARRR